MKYVKPIQMLPLILPWVILAFVVIASVLIFCKKWRTGIFLYILTIVVNWWGECIPFRLWPMHEKESPYNVRVLTFNIGSSRKNISDKIDKLTDLIRNNKPDIIYITELGNSIKPLLDTSLAKDYAYSIYADSHEFYSKYPLSERIALGLNENEEINVLKCLVVKGKDTITLYGCHLSSNNYTAELQYMTPDSIKSYSTLTQYFNNIERAYQKRIRMAEAITCDASKLNNRIIVLGDMNDVGGSKTLKLLENSGLKDAWWEGGFGYGATIHSPLSYRIDHILYSGQLRLNNVKVISSEGVSDHDALFAGFNF